MIHDLTRLLQARAGFGLCFRLGPPGPPCLSRFVAGVTVGASPPDRVAGIPECQDCARPVLKVFPVISIPGAGMN